MKKLFLNNTFIFALILTNTIIIFIQEFGLNFSILNFLESSFTILFGVEMFVKVHALGIKGYIEDKWNRLDFTLIIIALPSLFAIFLNDGIIALNFLLTIRILRVFKFFRLIKFLPNIGSLIIGVNRAIKASYVILLGFFSLILVVSIISCSLFKNIAPEYFNNPLNSFYSIFRLFSVEGWYEIPDLIASRTNSLVGILAKLYFVTLLLVGGIFGLSLVNSIFVDAMVSDNNDYLADEVKKINAKLDTLINELNQSDSKANNINK